MCGRTTLVAPPSDLKELFGLNEVPELLPRYNIAPTQPIAVIREPHRLEFLRWGLLLPDPRGRGPGINVRVETVARAPAYRDSFRGRRCLVIVDGFYEWQRREKVRQPFAIRRTDHKPFALAGIWAPYVTAEGETVDCCAIVTGPATGVVTALHNRMPMIVPPSAYERWLAADTPPAELPGLMAPDASALETYPVNTRVNSPANDDPTCIERAEPAPATLALFAS
jgi:putative SOS response-associated peptidase YedK